MNESFDMVEMKVPARPEYVGVLRLTASGIASRMGFSYDDIEDIKIALSEAVTNAVNHAYPDDEQGEIAVAFGIHENRVQIMVSDSGKSFNAKETREKLGPYDSSKPVETITEGGLGLFLIDTLMDEVQISDQAGVVVSMTKYLQRDEVDQSADTQTSKTK